MSREGATEIGMALKDARRRIGMDVKEAEERTKIRAKYLRALEAEDWEVLPAPAYVRGFLRTYGALLGLDGDHLADEFRRRHEATAGVTSPASEAVLQDRRRASGGGRPPSRGSLIAAVAVGIVALLLVLSLFGDGGDEGKPVAPVGKENPKKDEGNGGNGGDARKAGKSSGKDEKVKRTPIDIEIEALTAVQVCVVGGGESMIDSQVLAAGATEDFAGEKRFRIDFQSGGSLRLQAGKESMKLESAAGETSYEADSEGIREIDYAGPDCP